MNQTRIILDSTFDIPERVRAQVITVPLSIHFGGETLIDGVSINHQQFYERLTTCQTLPTTSQPAPGAFVAAYDEVTQAGDSAVVLTISSGLSGTYQSACIAAEGYENIHVVDTMNATLGAGVLAEYALSCVEQGMDASALAAHLTQKREDVCLIGLVDTLEYLKKGGRISSAVALAGGLLNIHPVLTIEDGKVVMIGKARGSKQGNNLLVQKIQQIGGVDFSMPILLGYTGLSDELLQRYIDDSRTLWENGVQELETLCAGSVIGTYTGPGAVIAAFFRKRN